MTAAALPPLAEEWLDRLWWAAERLPASEQADLVSEIESHLVESIPPGASEAEVRQVLDRLGDPEEIVAEAGGAPEPIPTPRRGGLEVAAIILLLIGGFLFVFGWLVGVVLLWSSRAWTLRDKLIGTLVVPGGFAFSAYLLLFGLRWDSGCTGTDTRGCSGNQSSLSSGLFLAALLVSFLAPIFTGIHLARSADRPS